MGIEVIGIIAILVISFGGFLVLSSLAISIFLNGLAEYKSKITENNAKATD